MSKIIGSKAGNKCKNRFLNIVVCKLEISLPNHIAYASHCFTDDGNRIALTPIGQYTDGYINASPIDVRT